MLDGVTYLDIHTRATQFSHRQGGPGLNALARQLLGEHPVVVVRQVHIAAARMGLQQTAVRRLGIGARHQAQRPRLGTFGQHRRNRPDLPGRAGNPDAQGDRGRIVGQFHIGPSRDQCALGQGFAATELHRVIGRVRLVYRRQRHTLGPGHTVQSGALGQQCAGAQLGADRQGLRLTQQGARSEQQVAAGIAHIGRDHAARWQYQLLAQRRGHRQAGAGGHRQRFDRQVVIQRAAGRERRAIGQGHAVARHHDGAAAEVDAR